MTVRGVGLVAQQRADYRHGLPGPQTAGGTGELAPDLRVRLDGGAIRESGRGGRLLDPPVSEQADGPPANVRVRVR